MAKDLPEMIIKLPNTKVVTFKYEQTIVYLDGSFRNFSLNIIWQLLFSYDSAHIFGGAGDQVEVVCYL